jgi:hypothetical protein
MRAALVYGRAATSWAMLGTTMALTVGLLTIVARWPYTMWPLHGGVIGLIAGTSAWAADEACATVVDVTPRPLWWRSAARATTPLVLAATWITVHLAAGRRLPDHLDLLLLQGVTAAMLGFAGATLLRGRGLAEPGQWIASFASPLTLGIALAKPWSGHAPLFPVWPHENWARSTIIWSAASLAALACALWAIWSDSRPRRAES